MDFVPKQGVKKPMDAETAAMLEVAPERRNAARMDFEASVASAVTEVQPEGNVQVRMTARRRVTEMEPIEVIQPEPVVQPTQAAQPEQSTEGARGIRPLRRLRRTRVRRVAKQPVQEVEQPFQEVEARTQAAELRGQAVERPRRVAEQPMEMSEQPARPVRRVQRVRVQPTGVRPLGAKRPVGATRATGTTQPTTARPTRVKRVAGTAQTTGATRATGVTTGVRPKVRRVATSPTAVTRANARAVDEIPLDADLLNDPLERPISEFADLEQLAQEIEEVTRGGAVIEEETGVVSAGSFSLQQEPEFGVVEDYQPRFIEAQVDKRPLSGTEAYSNAMEAELTEVREQASQENLARAKQAKVKAAAFGKPMRRVAKAGVAAGVAGVTMAGMAQGAQAASGVRRAATGARVATGTARTAAKVAGATARTASMAKIANGVTGASVHINSAAEQRAKMKIPQAHFINQNKVAKRPLSKNAYTARAEETTKPVAKDEPVQVVKSEKKGGTLGMIIAIIVTIILGAAAGTVAFLLLPR